MTDARLRRGRGSLALAFLVQGAAFALLVTRIPAIQDRYRIGDGLLPLFLAAVPVLAGLGSLAAERLVRRVRPSTVLRWSQPAVLLSLLAVTTGRELWQAAAALCLFGLAVGALDASMNMLGVSLQRAWGRSIMLGFHAAFSLGGILGASLAWVGAHERLPLVVPCLPVVLVLGPAVLAASRWYVDAPPATASGEARSARTAAVPLGALAPLCLVMAFAYIGDATVANWSATYVQDVLGGSEALATVPYNVYMATTLIGRTAGDRAVRRFGAVAVVRGGTLLAAAGFALVAAAPVPWTGMAGFTLLGLGLCVVVPQTFAAAGRLGGGGSDAAVARLNVFTYLGFLVGSPLVGGLGDAWSYRGAMLVPMVLVLATLVYARSFAAQPDRYGGPHERPRVVDVGRGGNGL
ncbi:MFS transporter [Streptomyces sanyensis]|uniref:MFS transporter n=1 Tax=Streptomyces sanyensis TaxID=568869 RepID=UPI003D788E6C